MDQTEVKKHKGGKPPLAADEPSIRGCFSLPMSVHAKATVRAGRRGFSAYVRSLIEKDLGLRPARGKAAKVEVNAD